MYHVGTWFDEKSWKLFVRKYTTLPQKQQYVCRVVNGFWLKYKFKLSYKKKNNNNKLTV